MKLVDQPAHDREMAARDRAKSLPNFREIPLNPKSEHQEKKAPFPLGIGASPSWPLFVDSRPVKLLTKTQICRTFPQ